MPKPMAANINIITALVSAWCLEMIPMSKLEIAALPSWRKPMTPEAVPDKSGLLAIACAVPRGSKKPLPNVKIDIDKMLVSTGVGLIYICKAKQAPPIKKIIYPYPIVLSVLKFLIIRFAAIFPATYVNDKVKNV